MQAGDEPLVGFVAALAALVKGDEASFQRSHDVLAQQPAGRSLLPLLTGIKEQQPRTPRSFDTRPKRSLQDSPDFDPEDVAVVAQVSNQLEGGQVFAHVLGVVGPSGFIELSRDEAKSIYQHSGDITAFPKAGPPGSYIVGATSTWRVERKATDKPTQFVASSVLGRVYDVVSVPHGSTDPDALRQWLQTEYSAPQGCLPLFELSDGLLLRPPAEASAGLASYRFDKPLDAFASVHGVTLKGGRRIVIGPLPASTAKLDCAPPLLLLKRLLRAEHLSRGFPPFTRAQIAALCEFLEAEQGEQWGSALHSARERLERAVGLREGIADVIDQLISIPQIKARIDAEVAAARERVVSDLNKEREATDKLRDEQRRLTESLEGARKAAREQEATLAKKIKSVFEKASAEGLDTLASIALFRGIVGDAQRATASSAAPISSPSSELDADIGRFTVGAPLRSAKDIKNAVMRATYATGLSGQMLAGIVAAGRACGVVGLHGRRRDQVASVLSHVLASGTRCSISVSADVFGMTDLLRTPALIQSPSASSAMPLGEFISAQSRHGRSSMIRLKGTNRVPPETFLPDLLSALSQPLIERRIAWDDRGTARLCDLSAPLIFLLEFECGTATFPICEPLSLEIPIVSVDHVWGDEPEPDHTVDSTPSEMTLESWCDLAPEAPLETIHKPESAIAGIAEKLGTHPAETGLLAAALLRAGRPGQSVISANTGGGVPSYLEALVEALTTSKAPSFTRGAED